MNPALTAILAGILVGMSSILSAPAAVTVTAPRCEYSDNPLGLDVRQPRLSWVLESKERAQR
jgi:alpha-L-rhamnosidase